MANEKKVSKEKGKMGKKDGKKRRKELEIL